MKRIARTARGFTLIELMIAVAIIGILASIAIPSLSRYRMRAFNASAESDVRNCKTSEELLMHDAQIYGSTEQPAKLPGGGGSQATGALLKGGLSGATAENPGALLSGTALDGEKRGVGIGLGNGVCLRADSMSNDSSFNVYAHHYQGSRVYAGEAESTAMLVCENERWIGASDIKATTYEVTTDGGDLEGKACGGLPEPTWIVQ